MRYHEHGDLAARDELIRSLMPLARQLALRYQRKSESLQRTSSRWRTWGS